MELTRGVRVLLSSVVATAAALAALAVLGEREPRLRIPKARAASLAAALSAPRRPEAAKRTSAASYSVVDGHRVREIADPWLDDIARVSISTTGAVIRINPLRCREAGREVCGFFREHEIGHVLLGHGAPRYTTLFDGPSTAEDEADCWAAQHATRIEVGAVIAFLSSNPWADSSRGAHRTGSERAERIRACRNL